MISDLDLDRLAGIVHLPQHRRLLTVVAELWRDRTTRAIWLGGSLARGAGDRWSDVDLRVAVEDARFSPDVMPSGAHHLAADSVGSHTLRFDEHAVLFHILLADGEIYDLLVQTASHPPTNEARLVLGCRDDALGERLLYGYDPVLHVAPADGAVIRQVIVDFWISQQKHQKVLARGLPLIAWEGEHRMRQELVRLWYVLATGEDPGPLGRTTIHTLAPVVRAVQERDTGALARIGRPLRDIAELVTAAADTADEVARVGRELATGLGFDYPEALEATVRQSWRWFGEFQVLWTRPTDERSSSPP
ncbi:MAG: hypothetical protein RLZZ387_4144 [Chloroflexota bacterium]|jgi:predicted nucleotidyltransferase